MNDAMAIHSMSMVPLLTNQFFFLSFALLRMTFASALQQQYKQLTNQKQVS
jgi:hypothetical protein